MSASEFLTVQKDDQVARITLNRPKHNVLNIPMMNDLNAELEAIAADDTLKCLVINGEGPSFCAGVEVGDHKPEQVDEMVAVFNRIFELINMIDIPVIGAVHGACLGGGMELAIACDIIIASKNAKFGQPEIKLGFFPPMPPCACPNWWARPRPSKSSPPAKPTKPKQPGKWDLSARWRTTMSLKRQWKPM